MAYSQTVTHKGSRHHLRFSDEGTCSLPKVVQVSKWQIPDEYRSLTLLSNIWFVTKDVLSMLVPPVLVD